MDLRQPKMRMPKTNLLRAPSVGDHVQGPFSNCSSAKNESNALTDARMLALAQGLPHNSLVKTRQKPELAILDFKRFAAGANRDPQGFDAYSVIRNLWRFEEQLARDPKNMRELLDAARQLAASRGRGQGRAERDLFECLHNISRECSNALRESGIKVAGRSESVSELARPYWEVLQALAEFAIFCLGFRKARDSFGGRRRIAAFDVLAEAGVFMHLPEAVSLAEQLERSNRDDGRAATDFLMSYYEARGTPERVVDPPKVLQLGIFLRHIHPRIWRRVLVPNDYSLGDLHHVINRVMGWSHWHMHAFRIGKIHYAGTETVEDCGPPIRHEDSVTLAALFKRKGQVFEYQYDFGDNWEHEIQVEKILSWNPDLQLPVCLAGERACPPEDCGGSSGYVRVLSALRNPNDSGLTEFRQWLGDFDPEEFDLEKVQRNLAAMVDDD